MECDQQPGDLTVPRPIHATLTNAGLRLRERFPAWRISATWITRGAGPGARLLRARRGSLTLSARTADALAAKIEAEQQAGDAIIGP